MTKIKTKKDLNNPGTRSIKGQRSDRAKYRLPIKDSIPLKQEEVGEDKIFVDGPELYEKETEDEIEVDSLQFNKSKKKGRPRKENSNEL